MTKWAWTAIVATAAGWAALITHLITQLATHGELIHTPLHSTAVGVLVAGTVVTAIVADHDRLRALIRQQWSMEHEVRPVEPSLAYMQDAATLFELGREAERRRRPE
jgi:hypothetical protein